VLPVPGGSVPAWIVLYRELVSGLDPEKKRTAIQSMLRDLEEVRQLIAEARGPLLIDERKTSVSERDILQSFQELTRAEDNLWHLLERMEAVGVGYLTVRQLNDLLSDVNVTYSLPGIQLSLRILIQSGQRLTSSEEAQARITRAYTGLRELQNQLATLKVNLERDMPS